MYCISLYCVFLSQPKKLLEQTLLFICPLQLGRGQNFLSTLIITSTVCKHYNFFSFKQFLIVQFFNMARNITKCNLVLTAIVILGIIISSVLLYSNFEVSYQVGRARRDSCQFQFPTKSWRWPKCLPHCDMGANPGSIVGFFE